MRLLKPNEKVTLLSEGRIYIDNGTHVKIYEKGFCIENFYNPTVRGHLYTSAFICKNENPSNNFYGRTLPEIWPLLRLSQHQVYTGFRTTADELSLEIDNYFKEKLWKCKKEKM